jgi:ABC-type transport system substrate-binding protein
MTGKFDVALLSAGVSPEYADLIGSYDCASFPPAGGNFGRYCDRALDAIMHAYDRSFDPAARRRETLAMERMMDADIPGIVLLERDFVAVYDRRLRGYAPSAYSFWGDPLALDL